jgi:branched-chain amino acid transport system permease protein
VLVLLSETLRNPKWLVQAGLLGDESPTVAFIEARLSNAHVLFYGVLVVVVVLFAPDGFLGLLRTAVARLKRRLTTRPGPPGQPAGAA